jgi:hypothetical protein
MMECATSRSDMPTLPPTFAAGALYDTLLQGALRHFFDRAAFDTEAVPSASSDGRLALEPSSDPSALTVRWFGSRHVLRVPERRPFTPHEVRFARAIGAVLAARYRAIFDPRLMAERGDLFRGFIEDRFVGAFLEDAPYRIGSAATRADRIATAIEVLRVAALSRYENRPISSGVLMLDSERDPCRADQRVPEGACLYSPALTATKSFYRLCDGEHTVFLVNRDGVLFNTVDIARWSAEWRGDASLTVPCANAHRPHARATLDSGHVCIILSPSYEIKVFAEGCEVFTFRNANWHLLDVAAKYEMWAQAVGDRVLAERVFQTALDLADARQGALFVVLRNPEEAVPRLIAAGDRLACPEVEPNQTPEPRVTRDLQFLLADRNAVQLEPTVLSALARIDGATVMDPHGRLIAVGAILLHPTGSAMPAGRAIEGARTTAAMAAGRFGPVLKISEDGAITCYDGERLFDL